MHFLVLSVTFLVFVVNVVKGIRIKPVTVFSPDESDYHKYSAILAATEPYRLQRDEEIKKTMSPMLFWYHKIKGTKINDPTCVLRLENKAVDQACERYEIKADEIVRSHGLNVVDFNGLSRKIMKEPPLKQKVLLQAYFYRIAADLEANITPTSLPTLNANLASSQKSGLVRLNGESSPIVKDLDPAASKLTRFALALKTIEQERLFKRKELKAELGLPELPQNMCEPSIQSCMCKTIQTACQEFPKTAVQIISQYGFDSAEFNALDNKVKKDLLFRYRVNRELYKHSKAN